MQTLSVNVDTMNLSRDLQLNEAPSVLIHAYALINGQAQDEVKTLEDAYTMLNIRFGGSQTWRVTHGGHHCALSINDHGKWIRVLLVTEI